MPDQQAYDFYAAVRAILSQIAAAEATGSVPEELHHVRQDTLRYQRQLDLLRAELERLLEEATQPAGPVARPRWLPAKRLACHHADSADTSRLIEGDLPPWMIDCSEPH